MEIRYEFLFDAAHRFPAMPDGHKYGRLHGHSFRAEVALAGDPDPKTGFVVDFAEVETACEKLRATLDHGCLNDIAGLETPSLENIARWLWKQLKPALPLLCRVTVRRDSCRQTCVHYGD